MPTGRPQAVASHEGRDRARFLHGRMVAKPDAPASDPKASLLPAERRHRSGNSGGEVCWPASNGNSQRTLRTSLSGGRSYLKGSFYGDAAVANRARSQHYLLKGYSRIFVGLRGRVMDAPLASGLAAADLQGDRAR